MKKTIRIVLTVFLTVFIFACAFTSCRTFNVGSDEKGKSESQNPAEGNNEQSPLEPAVEKVDQGTAEDDADLNTDTNVEKSSNEQPTVKSRAEFMHLSFDDVSLCFNNLANNAYSSLFDEPFFAQLKEMHDTYGAKFSLYSYNSVLATVPNDYASEFSQSADWLKIGMHSNRSGQSLANSSYNDGKKYWNDFVSNVVRITGNTACIDRIPRLEYFAGSYQALFGMRDAENGALGFLSADDSRLSYYFDEDVMTYLYDNDHLTDEENELLFLSTDVRGDWFYNNFSANNSYKTPTKTNVYDELVYRNGEESFASPFTSLILFTHEWLVYNGATLNDKFACIKDACKFAKDYSIAFDYAQNRNFTQNTSDSLFEKIDTALPSGSTIVSLDGVEHSVVFSLSELSLSIGYSITGSGKITEATGRATDRNNALAVNGGESITFVTDRIEDNALFFSVCEFDENGDFVVGGQKCRAWLNSCTLKGNTRYVLLAFRKGDGSTDFSADAPSILPTCLSIQ